MPLHDGGSRGTQDGKRVLLLSETEPMGVAQDCQLTMMTDSWVGHQVQERLCLRRRRLIAEWTLIELIYIDKLFPILIGLFLCVEWKPYHHHLGLKKKELHRDDDGQE